MTNWELFVAGWWRYWESYTQGWPMVIGFIVANVFGTIVYECLKSMSKIAIIILEASRLK